MQAAIQRAASTWQVQNMSPSAASDRIASALQQLQKDSQQQQAIVKHVKSIEAKLNALEGSVLTAGKINYAKCSNVNPLREHPVCLWQNPVLCGYAPITYDMQQILNLQLNSCLALIDINCRCLTDHICCAGRTECSGSCSAG